MTVAHATGPGAGDMISDIQTETARAQRVRDYAIKAFVRLTVTAVLLFVILRLLAPWLVSLHENLALCVGVGLVLLTPLIVIQLAYMLWNDWRRLRAA